MSVNLRHPTHLRPYRAKLFYSAQSPRALPWAVYAPRRWRVRPLIPAVTLYIKLWSNVETPGAGDNVTRSAYCAARAKLCFVVRISMPARGGFVAAEMEHLRSVR